MCLCRSSRLPHRTVRLIVTASQWKCCSIKETRKALGKIHLDISSPPPGICITEKESLSYLLIGFPFPFGGCAEGGGDRGLCNEKRNEAGLFLTERFVHTVDFTRRADISSSWRRRTRRKERWGEKMSLINQKQNDR